MKKIVFNVLKCAVIFLVFAFEMHEGFFPAAAFLLFIGLFFQKHIKALAEKIKFFAKAPYTDEDTVDEEIKKLKERGEVINARIQGILQNYRA